MKPNKRPHVLYVEDDEDSCMMMTTLLALSGIDVSCCQGIAATMRLKDRDMFDVFLLDLWLNDGDGYELCAKLRAAHPDIPVVFYSGCATERERKLGLAAGAAAYLVKPHSDLVAPTIMSLVAGDVRPAPLGSWLTDLADKYSGNTLFGLPASARIPQD